MAETPTPTKDPRDNVLTRLGVTGLRHTRGTVREQWHPKLQGYDREIKTWAEMGDRSSIVGAALTLMETWIVKTPTRVKSAPVNSVRAQECAELFEEALGDMDHTLKDHVSEFCSTNQFGWSYFWPEWKWRRGLDPGVDPETQQPFARSKFNDGKIGLRGIWPRSQDTLVRWEIAPDGAIRGMWQTDPNNSRAPVLMPIEASLHFRLRPRKNNPQGRGFCQAAFFPYYYTVKFEEFEGIRIEKDATGTVVVKVPQAWLMADASEQQTTIVEQLFNYTTQMRVSPDRGVIMPSGDEFGLSVIGAPGGDPGYIRAAIRDKQKEQAMAMVSEIMLVGMGEKGALNLAEDKKNTLGMALDGVLDVWCEGMNTLASRFAMLNGYTAEESPRMSHDPVIAPSLKDLGEFLANITPGGWLENGAEIGRTLRERVNFPPPDMDPEEAAGPRENETANAVSLAIRNLSAAAAESEQRGDAKTAEALRAKITELLARI